MTIEAGAPHHKSAEAVRPAGLPKLLKPYLFITSYYGIAAAILAAALIVFPDAIRLLPVGGAANFGAVGQSAFEPVTASPTQPGESTLTEGVKLALAMAATFLLMLPVTWICMGARRRKDVSQSFIQTILVLPMVITGIVHVVHNSLALAFSLAGIVAGVRFRHTLKDSAETTYLFTAIGVGVACGVNAVEVAAVITVFFNYAVLGMWATEYGSGSTGRRMFSHVWMAKKAEPENGRHPDHRGVGPVQVHAGED